MALGIPATRDWDDALTKARAALNWEKHFELAFDGDTARRIQAEKLVQIRVPERAATDAAPGE